MDFTIGNLDETNGCLLNARGFMFWITDEAADQEFQP